MREIESTTVWDVEDFIGEVVPPLGFQRHPVYRGQANQKWALIPGLMRTNLRRTEFKNWLDLEASILWKFKQQAFSCLESEPHSELEWISVAQNAGVPTRFTSWTDEALTALYFATQKTADRSPGVVWRILPGDRSLVVSQDHEQVPESARLYQPRFSTDQIRAQSTWFLSHPLPEYDTKALSFEDYYRCGDDFINLAKIVIPAEAKPRIRQTLGSLGVHAAKLFPGLNGIAARIRSELYAHTDSYDWIIGL